MQHADRSWWCDPLLRPALHGLAHGRSAWVSNGWRVASSVLYCNSTYCTGTWYAGHKTERERRAGCKVCRFGRSIARLDCMSMTQLATKARAPVDLVVLVCEGRTCTVLHSPFTVLVIDPHDPAPAHPGRAPSVHARREFNVEKSLKKTDSTHKLRLG